MMRGLENSMETVNAAASAIIQAESRVQQVTSPRRRSGGCLNIYWCFGSQKPAKRISHAVYVPQEAPPGSDQLSLHNSALLPPPPLPFTAPPSSPASFLQSGTSSATLSPVLSGCSPGGVASIFAVGPYAHETQLVSPPVFSTFTTEPSTAPLTPPPEPTHLTTPPSPEVPFARLLASSFDSTQKQSEGYEFQSYLLYPGSPIGNLISPGSVCSGASSPFPGPDIAVDHRVSFDLTVEEVARCLAKEPAVAGRVASEAPVPAPECSASKDFKFDNTDGGAAGEATAGGSDWWANEKVAGSEPEQQGKNWAFFPMVVQSGAS